MCKARISPACLSHSKSGAESNRIENVELVHGCAYCAGVEQQLCAEADCRQLQEVATCRTRRQLHAKELERACLDQASVEESLPIPSTACAEEAAHSDV